MKYIIVLGGNQSSELVHVKIAYREETTLSCHPAINTRGVWSLIKDMQRKSPARLLVDIANDRKLTRGV